MSKHRWSACLKTSNCYVQVNEFIPYLQIHGPTFAPDCWQLVSNPNARTTTGKLTGITWYEAWYTSVKQVSQGELRLAIQSVLKTLSYREREIIKLRYGLGPTEEVHTLEEVGRIFKVTRGRVREIEARAMRKLQMPNRAQELAGFID